MDIFTMNHHRSLRMPALGDRNRLGRNLQRTNLYDDFAF